MDNKEVKTILIDVDGVLTDGCLTIDHKGEKLFKRFHTRDVRAIRELVWNGFEVILVTADEWFGITHFADKVGADLDFVKDKSTLKYTNYYAIGDDAWDIPMLLKAKKAFCPVDADPGVLQLPGIYVLPRAGGRGVVADFVRVILD